MDEKTIREKLRTFITHELIRDPHFQRGFLLLDPQPGRRVVYGEITEASATARPVWDLAQWSSRFRLAATRAARDTEGLLCFSNIAKQVIIGTPGGGADLALGVNAGVEYGQRARQSPAQPWVHLLVQQEIENPPSLSGMTACRFELQARLTQARLHRTEDYSPGLHAAQFLVYLTVCNRSTDAPAAGRCFWFGIPIYDDRHRVVPQYQARDFGDTDMFISTQSSSEFTRQSTHDGEWVTFERDLLPLIRAALEEAWRRGFLTGSREFGDYSLSGIFIGWEVPGLFDVEMQIRNLSLRALAAAPR